MRIIKEIYSLRLVQAVQKYHKCFVLMPLIKRYKLDSSVMYIDLQPGHID